MRVANGIPLGCPPLLPVGTVNCVQTLKVRDRVPVLLVGSGLPEAAPPRPAKPSGNPPRYSGVPAFDAEGDDFTDTNMTQRGYGILAPGGVDVDVDVDVPPRPSKPSDGDGSIQRQISIDADAPPRPKTNTKPMKSAPSPTSLVSTTWAEPSLGHVNTWAEPSLGQVVSVQPGDPPTTTTTTPHLFSSIAHGPVRVLRYRRCSLVGTS